MVIAYYSERKQIKIKVKAGLREGPGEGFWLCSVEAHIQGSILPATAYANISQLLPTREACLAAQSPGLLRSDSYSGAQSLRLTETGLQKHSFTTNPVVPWAAWGGAEPLAAWGTLTEWGTARTQALSQCRAKDHPWGFGEGAEFGQHRPAALSLSCTSISRAIFWWMPVFLAEYMGVRSVTVCT